MTSPRWIKHCIAAACCACGMATASADTVTLTFDNIGFDGPYPESWTESGFVITSLSPDGPHLHAGADTLLLHSNVGSSPYHIQRADGGAFDFLGFDYSGGDSVFVTNTGATFTILGDQPLASFTMSAAFQNVTWVNWYMNTLDPNDPFQEQWGSLDNVVTNVMAVPEPGHVAMFGLGLAALALQGRRVQRRQATKRFS